MWCGCLPELVPSRVEGRSRRIGVVVVLAGGVGGRDEAIERVACPELVPSRVEGRSRRIGGKRSEG